MNKIILTAEADLHDNELREWVKRLETKIDTINERTKRQTIQITKLEKENKELKKKLENENNYRKD